MVIKQDSKAIFIDASIEVIAGMQLPDIELKKKLAGEFDYHHLFVKKQVNRKGHSES